MTPVRQTPPQRSNASRLFGYDLFISFALGVPPRGTLSYASDLARRLRERDFTVFFSEDEAAPGDRLDSTLRTALLRSKALVVIANRGMLTDPRWVRVEVEEFTRRHSDRPVILISVGGAIQDPSLAAANEWLHFADRIWLDEPDQAVATGIASDALVNRLATVPIRSRSNLRWRWVLRATGAVLVTLAITAAGAAWIANRQANLARAAERDALRRLYIAQMNRAYHAWEENNPALTTELLRSIVPADGREDLRSFDWYYLWRTLHGDLATITEPDQIGAVVISPDAKRVAVSTTTGGVRLYDADGTSRLELPAGSGRNPIEHFAFTPTGTLVGFGNEGLRTWTLSNPSPPPAEIPLDTSWSGPRVMSKDGATIAFVDRSGALVVRSTDRDVTHLAVQPQPSSLHALALAPDGARLAAGTGTGEILIGERDGAWRLSTVGTEAGSFDAMTFSPDGRYLAIGLQRGEVKIWDVASRRATHTLSLGDSTMAIRALDVSGDGQVVAAGAGDPFDYNSGKPGLVAVWHIDVNRPHIYRGHMNAVTSVSLATGGRTLVSGSADRTVKVWDADTDQDVLTMMKQEHTRIFAVALSEDGTRVVTGSEGPSTGTPGDVDLWDVPAQKPLRTLRAHSSDVEAVLIQPDGTIVSGSSDGTVILWDAAAGVARSVLKTDPTFPIYAIAVNPVRHMLAAGGGPFNGGGRIQLWDLRTLQPITSAGGLTEPVRAIGFLRTGNWLAVGAGSENPTSSRTLELFSVPAMVDSGAFRDFSVAVRSLAFSPSGDMLAVGWSDRDKTGDISVWDLDPVRERGRLRGHLNMVMSLAFSADGRTLVSSSGAGVTHTAGEIRIWDVASMQERATLARLPRPIWQIALSADGRTLAGVTGDQSVSIWRAAAPADSGTRR